MALNPAMDYNNFMRGRLGSVGMHNTLTPTPSKFRRLTRATAVADFYHISCFEEIADLSQRAFLDLTSPLTRSNFRFRGVKGTSVLDGNYLVDGGAERLLLQWKVTRGGQIDERDGVVQNTEPLAANFQDLLDKAGQPGFQPQMVTGMTMHEFMYLSRTLAPNESDGPDDSEVWNLFENYLTASDPARLNNRHDLSEMLSKWDAHTASNPHIYI